MKKIIYHFIAIAVLISITYSCDFVQNANPPLEPSGASTTGSTTGSNTIYRKVLLEDYTGHKCGNCPVAAEMLTTLEAQYPGKIVPMAVHAGFFATTNPMYPTDFRNTAGNAYDAVFGISAAGNPNGLTNRTGYGTGSFIKAYTSWGSEVAQLITQAAKFQIKIKTVFNTASNSLSTDVTIKSLGSNSGSYKLVVLLTEDSIIAEQLDYRLPSGNQITPNYQFNHVLRGAINSEWGDAIFTTAANLNDSIVKSYSNFSLNTSFNASKCNVIAYVYDADLNSPTYYEVLQVEEVKVK